MKISKISITFIPNEEEKLQEKTQRTIYRNEDKLWHGLDTAGQPGMFPNEIKLVNEIQNILGVYNSNDKRNQ